MRGHATVARYAAPAAFLVAATIAILIVRAGLSSDETGPTTLPAATTTAEEPAGTTTVAATTTDASGAEFYEIEPGDTLAVVADQFDTTVERLLVLNPDIDPVALRIGQRIRVE